MNDLFDRENKILDNAIRHLNEVRNGAPCSRDEFEALVKEYGRLLKQLRRVTKLSDRTTVNLNTSKLDLLDKVHYDVLTGIYNRRFMEDTLKRSIGSIARSEGLLSVCMIDIDFFKDYNDNYGHNAGDICLKAVAGTLKSSIVRQDDFVARYGGEEFIAVLPNTDEKGARHVANIMLENVRALNIPHERSKAADVVTVSIGVTTGSVKFSQVGTDYIKQADKALYMSKQNGRNKYTFIDYGEEVG